MQNVRMPAPVIEYSLIAILHFHCLRDNVFSRPPTSWIDGATEESIMLSQPRAAGWLAENGPKELELLFRAIVFHPAAPILIADDDRQYWEASVGASKLLGLPREKIIGRSLDDFAEPGFKAVISELWRAFLEKGEQQGTLQLVGPDGGPRDLEYSAKANVLPVRHLVVLRDKTSDTRGGGPVEADKDHSKSSVPAWVQDYALFLLDVDGQVVACMRERNAFTATRAVRSSANTCRSSIPAKTLSASCRKN
jgi:PAS domain S-box-containing protein